MRSRPGARHQALGPGDRARVEGAVGELVAELVCFVGDNQHVVPNTLGEAGDLGLDREMPGIGPPCPRDKSPRLFLNDVGLKLLRGMADVGGEFAIALAMADDQRRLVQRLTTRYWTSASASIARLGKR